VYIITDISKLDSLRVKYRLWLILHCGILCLFFLALQSISDLHFILYSGDFLNSLSDKRSILDEYSITGQHKKSRNASIPEARFEPPTPVIEPLYTKFPLARSPVRPPLSGYPQSNKSRASRRKVLTLLQSRCAAEIPATSLA
jgi:hypothetical protein